MKPGEGTGGGWDLPGQEPVEPGQGVPVEAGEAAAGLAGEADRDAGAPGAAPAAGDAAVPQADGAALDYEIVEAPVPWVRELQDELLVLDLARACHEANRALQAVGDEAAASPPWAEAPEWQRSSAVDGVLAILHGTVTGPEQSHEHWLAVRRAAGWVWGPEKDAERRTHPCLVPYAELPAAQRAKDGVFFAIVTALSVPVAT